MKRSSTVMSVLGVTSLFFLVSAGYGLCWQPVVPPHGPPVGVPAGPYPPPAFGPAPMPFNAGPCFPRPCDPPLTVEGGARGIYATNSASLHIDRGGDIDFVRDLRFSESTLLGEVYAAVRSVPTLAVTYTFMIPREDRGNGVLPAPLIAGRTLFNPGERVSIKYELTIHRWEGEVYPVFGWNYRLGGWVLAELLVSHLRVENQQGVSDSENSSEFIMGVGGVGEVSPSSNVFARFKGAYTFLQNHSGVYLEGEGKFFPQFGPGMRPYVGAGYRYRYIDWSLDGGNRKWNITAHGPFAEVGIIF